MKPRRVTGVTVQQQRRIDRAVKTAREMTLLPYPSRPAVHGVHHPQRPRCQGRLGAYGAGRPGRSCRIR
ncbi:hypothetical protein [Nonomuraea fuscirosea]|uniref:hypothetical protein n=1 Tax=Nonomuraea fuscirosea TaxID=1291556 RepID=UPI003F4DA610